VVYLLHGANNDHYSWYRYGRANGILDNLLAEGAIKPFIAVMPLGYGGASADGRSGPSGARGGAGDFYEQDILKDIIPMIDARYRTIADRKHRAIVGFSMGGGQSSRIGLGHLDTFSYIGVFSAGLSGNTETEPFKTLAADVAATNKQIDLLWIACGKDDAAITGARNFSNTLKQIGVDHKFIESDGAHHWSVWRRYLHEIAPLLFQSVASQ
jgi:enterochelin esterase-like enzyme